VSYPAGSLPQAVLQIGDARLDGLRLLIIGLSIILMAALTYVVRATQLGRDIRALAENPRAARLLGVDVGRTIAATFFISSGLGGVAGALLGFAYNAIYPQMGTPYELKAFTVMVVGGMGSLPGAVLGAYILGIGEIAALVFLPAEFAELRDALAFGLLFLVLVIRPRGLLGHRVADRA
jgi:branched-chain amino acid transport system permease protein